MEKFMILELGQEIWKMSLEHLVWCENLKKKSAQKTFKRGSNISRGMTKVYTKGYDRKSSQWPIREQLENKNI